MGLESIYSDLEQFRTGKREEVTATLHLGNGKTKLIEIEQDVYEGRLGDVLDLYLELKLRNKSWWQPWSSKRLTDKWQEEKLRNCLNQLRVRWYGG